MSNQGAAPFDPSRLRRADLHAESGRLLVSRLRAFTGAIWNDLSSDCESTSASPTRPDPATGEAATGSSGDIRVDFGRRNGRSRVPVAAFRLVEGGRRRHQPVGVSAHSIGRGRHSGRRDSCRGQRVPFGGTAWLGRRSGVASAHSSHWGQCVGACPCGWGGWSVYQSDVRQWGSRRDCRSTQRFDVRGQDPSPCSSSSR